VTRPLVIPSNIPWDTLKRVDLEECLYWLLAEMGAEELEWRRGGKGHGASDQGRDIEAVFARPTPDGESERQHWWVEAKGRGQTVEPSAVKESVLNTQARKDLDILIIATNTQFSNPTKDWIHEWQEEHPRPKVRLWERQHLEKLLITYPSVAVRLFEDALSAQAKAEVAGLRFWSHLHAPSKSSVQEFWRMRKDMNKLTERAWFALIVGSTLHGLLDYHPWLALVDDQTLQQVLSVTAKETSYVQAQAEGMLGLAVGTALAYVMMTALFRLEVETICRLIGDVDDPANLSMHIIWETGWQFRSICGSWCGRFKWGSSSSSSTQRSCLAGFWARFGPPTDEEPEETVITHSTATVTELPDVPCKVGFQVDGENNCPLWSTRLASDTYRETLLLLQKALRKAVASHEVSG